MSRITNYEAVSDYVGDWLRLAFDRFFRSNQVSNQVSHISRATSENTGAGLASDRLQADLIDFNRPLATAAALATTDGQVAAHGSSIADAAELADHGSFQQGRPVAFDVLAWWPPRAPRTAWT